jgi:hypothetical protein
MKHVSNFGGWKAENNINESLILTIQAGIVLGLLGIKGLMLIVNKVAQKVGEGIELPKSELKSLVNDIISDIKKADKGNTSFAELERELKKRIDSGEITKAKDIIPVIKEFTK